METIEMKIFNQTMKKVWVFSVAAALIAGGGVTMNFMLSSKTFADTGAQLIQNPTGNVQPKGTPAMTEAKAEYTVIDQSKTYTKDKLMETYKLKGAPQDQLESRANEILSTYTPGDKDISAEQAAAYGAGMLKKVFAANLSGYTASAAFLRGPLPGTDTWTVSFDPASQTEKANANLAKSYTVFLNSVNGTIINALSSDDMSALKNVDLIDSGWQEKAKQAVTGLLPKNVSITSCKVKASDGLNIGVPVLCELSDDTAYMVGLAGENKDVVNLYFFQNGYDGSLNNTINKQKHMTK
jgi:hypothetical protein